MLLEVGCFQLWHYIDGEGVYQGVYSLFPPLQTKKLSPLLNVWQSLQKQSRDIPSDQTELISRVNTLKNYCW